MCSMPTIAPAVATYPDSAESLALISPELVMVDPVLRGMVLARMAQGRPDRPGEACTCAVSGPRVMLPATATRGGALDPARVRNVVGALYGLALVLAVGFSFPVTFPGLGVEALVAKGFPSSALVPPRRPTWKAGQAASAVSVREFAWTPSPGATSYEVALYEGNARVFLSYTRTPMVRIPVVSQGSPASSSPSVAPGTYEWYVWPLRKGHPSGPAIVQSRVVLTAE
jgi:hypothetical protein